VANSVSSHRLEALPLVPTTPASVHPNRGMRVDSIGIIRVLPSPVTPATSDKSPSRKFALFLRGRGERKAHTYDMGCYQQSSGIDVVRRWLSVLVLKSFVAGLVATIIAAIAAAIIFIGILMFAGRDLPEGQALAWDPISLLRSSVVAWAILGTAFLFGFVWQYRRG